MLKGFYKTEKSLSDSTADTLADRATFFYFPYDTSVNIPAR